MTDSAVKVLSDVREYIKSLSEEEADKVRAHIRYVIEGELSVVHTKQLSGPIRELIVKQHRFIYFKKGDTLYFCGAFKKQSARTPKREIDHAKALYKAA